MIRRNLMLAIALLTIISCQKPDNRSAISFNAAAEGIDTKATLDEGLPPTTQARGRNDEKTRNDDGNDEEQNATGLPRCARNDGNDGNDGNDVTTKAEENALPAGSNAVTSPSELTAFGIFAMMADNKTSVGTNVFKTNDAQRVYGYPNWTYDSKEYWDYGKEYRFRAYHPFSSPSIIPHNSSADDIHLTYKVGAASQDDLLFAFSSKIANESTVTQRVMMNFQHALAALEFRVIFKETVTPADSRDYITSFYLQGLHPTADVHYTHSAGNLHDGVINWLIPEYFEEVDHFYEWSGSKEFGVATSAENATEEATPFLAMDHLVFAIPQTIKEGKTKIYFTIDSSGDELFEATLPTDTWETGKKYVYTIILTGSNAEVTLKIKNWEVIQSGYGIHL